MVTVPSITKAQVGDISGFHGKTTLTFLLLLFMDNDLYSSTCLTFLWEEMGYF